MRCDHDGCDKQDAYQYVTQRPSNGELVCVLGFCEEHADPGMLPVVVAELVLDWQIPIDRMMAMVDRYVATLDNPPQDALAYVAEHEQEFVEAMPRLTREDMNG